MLHYSNWLPLKYFAVEKSTPLLESAVETMVPGPPLRSYRLLSRIIMNYLPLLAAHNHCQNDCIIWNMSSIFSIPFNCIIWSYCVLPTGTTVDQVYTVPENCLTWIFILHVLFSFFARIFWIGRYFAPVFCFKQRVNLFFHHISLTWLSTQLWTEIELRIFFGIKKKFLDIIGFVETNIT